jgi:hypothetical protein
VQDAAILNVAAVADNDRIEVASYNCVVPNSRLLSYADLADYGGTGGDPRGGVDIGKVIV